MAANQSTAARPPATISKSGGPLPLSRCLPAPALLRPPALSHLPPGDAFISQPRLSHSFEIPSQSILRGSYFFRLYPLRGTFHSLADTRARRRDFSGKAKQASQHSTSLRVTCTLPAEVEPCRPCASRPTSLRPSPAHQYHHTTPTLIPSSTLLKALPAAPSLLLVTAPTSPSPSSPPFHITSAASEGDIRLFISHFWYESTSSPHHLTTSSIQAYRYHLAHDPIVTRHSLEHLSSSALHHFTHAL